MNIDPTTVEPYRQLVRAAAERVAGHFGPSSPLDFAAFMARLVGATALFRPEGLPVATARDIRDDIAADVFAHLADERIRSERATELETLAGLIA